MQNSLVDQVFALLGEAKELEDIACPSGGDEAPLQKQEQATSWVVLAQSASKYNEACYLMKQHVRKSSSDIGNENPEDSAKLKELFTDKIDQYELHAQDLLDKVEGLKLTENQQQKRSSIGKHSIHDKNDPKNGKGGTDGKKKVTARASEGIRSAGTKGKRFLRKAKGKGLKTLKLSGQKEKNKKNNEENDMQLDSSSSDGHQTCGDDPEQNKGNEIMQDWVSVEPENNEKAPEQNDGNGNEIVNKSFNNEGGNSSWEAAHAISQLSFGNNSANAVPSPEDGCTIRHDSIHAEKRACEAAIYSDKANQWLNTALNHDERKDYSKAIDPYLNAVEYYSQAINILSSDEGGDGGTVTAGGESPWQSPESSTPATQHKELVDMKRKSALALDRVEKLKRMSMTSGVVPVPAVEPSAPAQISLNSQISQHPSKSNTNQPDKLTPAEIEVLKWSSHIASGVFMPWSDDEAQQFNRSHTRSWLAPKKQDLLPLSDKQKDRKCKWARPTEIVAMRRKSCQIAMINSITPYNIKQHCVSDCSFIAGLCISAAYERRFKRRLVSSLIYPQDSKTGMPMYNPEGVYMVKLWLNGVARRVIVDDYLPVDEQGNLLCSHTATFGKSNASVLELWVPLLEKAYMKLCGGYDFPGSNSGVDLFCLTGWIPERLFFPENPKKVKDFETPVERAWQRVYGATTTGDCLVTLSTSKELSDEEAEKVGLFTGHAYAVLGVVKTKNGTRLLQLKNPWASKGWKGRFSSRDKESWKDKDFCAEVGYDAAEASQYDDGVFWMSWDDILLYFRNIHLSWSTDPELFRFRTAVHGYWPEDRGPKDDSYNVGENPQYTITLSDEAIQKKGTVWILLSRHVTKQEQEGAEVSDFLTLHIHRIKNPKQRVWYPNSNCILTGAYTNNQHVLVRYDATGPEDKCLSIVLSQYEKSENLAYTLSCFCTEKFELGDPEQSLSMYQELSGSWKLRDSLSDKSCSLAIGTAGGPPGKGSFGSNPQWSIRVPSRGVRIQLKCLAPKKIPVNIILARSNLSNGQQGETNTDQMSKRIHHLYEDPIIDTGSYRYGFAVSDIFFVPAGLYTLCASAFEVEQVGNFLLHVFSSNGVHISEIN